MILPKVAAVALGTLLAGAAPLGAQAPDTEIFLLSLARTNDGLTVGTPRNITSRAGYDNQPSFTPDGRAILYTSVRDDAQADIYRYDLSSGSTNRLTTTAPESEYSAVVTPDGRAVSVVRVERDSTQRLWRFPLDGGAPSVILEHAKPVGYYAWSDATTLWMFVLGDPPTLQRAAVGDTVARIVARNVGRSIRRIPGGGISAVLKISPDEWWIARIDPETEEIERLVRTRPGQEDYAWAPDGSILMAEQATLYRWAPGGDWTAVKTFDEPGMARLTRLAVSDDGSWLAVVGSAAR